MPRSCCDDDSAAQGEKHRGDAARAPVGGLASLIRAAGGEAILFPVIEIRDVEDPRALHALIDRLHEFDLAVFISPNAAAKALTAISARRALPRRSRSRRLARAAQGTCALRRGEVIAPAGRATAKPCSNCLSSRSRRVSGSLYSAAKAGGVARRQSAGTRCLVEYAQCYRRVSPRAIPRRSSTRGAYGLSAITVTSSEGLRHLFDMVGTAGQAPLVKTPVFAPHPRIVQAARKLGLATVIAAEPGDEGLVAG